MGLLKVAFGTGAGAGAGAGKSAVQVHNIFKFIGLVKIVFIFQHHL